MKAIHYTHSLLKRSQELIFRYRMLGCMGYKKKSYRNKWGGFMWHTRKASKSIAGKSTDTGISTEMIFCVLVMNYFHAMHLWKSRNLLHTQLCGGYIFNK